MIPGIILNNIWQNMKLFIHGNTFQEIIVFLIDTRVAYKKMGYEIAVSLLH